MSKCLCACDNVRFSGLWILLQINGYDGKKIILAMGFELRGQQNSMISKENFVESHSNIVYLKLTKIF